MNYTLHQLQVFAEVVRQQSITKAAEEMHMTQPALSIQLKNFQLQFDVPLTETIGRKIYITEFGYSIAEIAANILREAESIQHKTREYKGLLTGKLRIASASTGKYILPYLLSGFLEKNQSVELQLIVSNKINVYASLRTNEIDFALATSVPENYAFEEETLIENRLYMVGNKNHLDTTKPYIFREEGSATRTAMINYLGNENELRKFELTSNEAVKQAVIAGLGHSLIPLIGIKNELINRQLYIIKMKSLPIYSLWRMLWIRNKNLSPVAAAFLEYLRNEKEAIVKDHFHWYLDFDEK